MLRKKSTLYFNFVILLLLSNISSAQDVANIYKQSKSSIVLIISQDKDQAPLALGTGFYFKKNLIATNYHVIEGASSFVIKNIGSEKTFTDAKVKSFSEKLDIALLEVKQENTPLPLADESNQEIGKKVVVIGNPKGLEGSVSTGIISGIRKVDKYNIYQITAPISPGSSGGPVFDETGSVIGLATFTIKNSQNINFAMPSSLLLELENKNMSWDPNIAIEDIHIVENAGLQLKYLVKNSVKYTISLKNNTHNTIEKINFVTLYYTDDGEICHFTLKTLSQYHVIPPLLAKTKEYFLPLSLLHNKNISYEIRILSYDIVEDENTDDIFEQLLR